MEDILRLAHKVINYSRKLIVCLSCRHKFESRYFIDHIITQHPDFDVKNQCIFCFHRFRDNRYEQHFRCCFKKKSIMAKMMYRQKDVVIQTATAERVLNADYPSRQTFMVFETRGTLPSTITWQQATNLVDLSKQAIIIKSTEAKDVLVAQEEQKPETLRLATDVLLSFHPHRWFHLIVCEKHIATLQNLLRGRTDMFVPDFGSWCRSPSLIYQENVEPDKVLHYHMLLYTENANWKREIWNCLVSDNRSRYKVYRVIKNVKHLSNVLHYISQRRTCEGGETKHFNIQRPISGTLELLTKLVNPVVYLEEVHALMLTNIQNFDLYKTHDQHNNVTYYTPLKSIMEQIRHFNLPIVENYRLELTTHVDINDFTLTYTRDGRYVNMVPGTSKVTVASVLNLLYPNVNIVWSKKLHTVAHSMFVAAQARCPRCFPIECGLQPLAFGSIERPGEIVLTFAVKNIGNVVQVALYGRREVVLNVFVNDKCFYMNDVKRLATSEQQLKEYLLGYFAEEKRIVLMAQNEEPFRFLESLLTVPDNVELVNVKHTLSSKFRNRKSLERCAELVGYDSYDEPLEDAGNQAKLLYELLCLE